MKRIISLLPLLFIQACGSGLHIGPLTNNVVFIGDSITAGWGQQAAFQAHSNWINQGISGENSGEISSRFETDVLFRHPATVHILAGTNDVYPGWAPCKGDDRNTCANMRSMVEKAKHYGIRVVIGTIPPWGCADNPVCGQSIADVTPERYARISQLNEWLMNFAVEEGITCVDYHMALTNTEGLHYAKGLTNDGVHPSPEGDAIMQHLVESVLP